MINKVKVKKIDVDLMNDLKNKLTEYKESLNSAQTEDELEKKKSELHTSLHNVSCQSCELITNVEKDIDFNCISTLVERKATILLDEEDDAVISEVIDVLQLNKQ